MFTVVVVKGFSAFSYRVSVLECLRERRKRGPEGPIAEEPVLSPVVLQSSSFSPKQCKMQPMQTQCQRQS